MKKILLLGGTGLVGKAIHQALRDTYQVVITAGHHEVTGGWRLPAEEPERLLSILNKEDPDIVISSIRGDFHAQLQFHATLADWLTGKEKRLLFLSTVNVFDGDLSRPSTETDLPAPGSDYGVYKRDCEAMLQKALQKQLIIFRLATVWAEKCPRLHRLAECSRSGTPARTHQNYMVNVSLAEQIGWYAQYVLDQGLTGVFHVGTTDIVDYCDFEQRVCAAAGIPLPVFEVETTTVKAFQAVIPTRHDIPERLQLTVDQVLQLLSGHATMCVSSSRK